MADDLYKQYFKMSTMKHERGWEVILKLTKDFFITGYNDTSKKLLKAVFKKQYNIYKYSVLF